MNPKQNISSNLRSSSINKKSLFQRTSSNKSFFQALNNSDNLVSYIKNGFEQTMSAKRGNGPMGNNVSILKRRLLDLKCKFSALQGERTRKVQLQGKLKEVMKEKIDKENLNREETEGLMKNLSLLRGRLEEEKMILQKAKLTKEHKIQDIRKMEELVNAKGEELNELEAKRTEFRKKHNVLMSEKDSHEKEHFLLTEEVGRLELEGTRLDRHLKKSQANHKNALITTEKMQVPYLFLNDYLTDLLLLLFLKIEQLRFERIYYDK